MCELSCMSWLPPRDSNSSGLAELPKGCSQPIHLGLKLCDTRELNAQFALRFNKACFHGAGRSWRRTQAAPHVRGARQRGRYRSPDFHNVSGVLEHMPRPNGAAVLNWTVGSGPLLSGNRCPDQHSADSGCFVLWRDTGTLVPRVLNVIKTNSRTTSAALAPFGC
jgi:hypothetical protein